MYNRVLPSNIQLNQFKVNSSKTQCLYSTTIHAYSDMQVICKPGMALASRTIQRQIVAQTYILSPINVRHAYLLEFCVYFYQYLPTIYHT
jgi:hypothetical protein